MNLKNKKSKIWFVSRDELQQMYDTHSTLQGILTAIGMVASSGNRMTLNRRAEYDNICTSKFSENFKKLKLEEMRRLTRKKNDVDFFTEDSNIARKAVKLRILQKNLIENKCRDCNLRDLYNDKPIVLQLEHINGINNDNRLENLCFLCPNCHSQTSTYAGRNATRHRIDRDSRKSSYRKLVEQKRKFNMPKDELEILIQTTPMKHIGKMYDVSDNTIKKHCMRLGIDLSIAKHHKCRKK